MHTTTSYWRASLQGPDAGAEADCHGLTKSSRCARQSSSMACRAVTFVSHFDANARPTVNHLHQVLQYVAHCNAKLVKAVTA